MDSGHPLRVTRKGKGLTLKQLSEATGLGLSTISEIERGNQPGLTTARKLAEALGVTVDDIFPQQQDGAA